MVSSLNVIERPMRLKVCSILDTTTYTPTVDASPTFFDLATYTFTPGTTDNVILWIRFRCDVTTQGSFSHSFVKIVFDCPAAEITALGMTAQTFYTGYTGIQDNSKTNFTCPWHHSRHATGTTRTSAAHKFGDWSGKSSYVFKSQGARRDSSDNMSNVELEIGYLTGAEIKGSITKA